MNNGLERHDGYRVANTPHKGPLDSYRRKALPRKRRKRDHSDKSAKMKVELGFLQKKEGNARIAI